MYIKLSRVRHTGSPYVASRTDFNKSEPLDYTYEFLKDKEIDKDNYSFVYREMREKAEPLLYDMGFFKHFHEAIRVCISK